MLERLGYAVVVARSGQEAADRLQQSADRIDMVIMDMVMPDIKAEQLLGIIRQNHSQAKVVLSSGYSMTHFQSGDWLKRSAGFLQKPYQLAELSKIVRTTIAS
jgi:CheY-like chemotaxis protein